MSREIEWTVISRSCDYAGHLGAVEGLFEIVFGRAFPQRAWEQYYFGNPYGDPIASLAYCGPKLVAHQALIPCAASAGGVNVPYHLSMSTMVHPAHRSMPVLIDLFTRVHREALQPGAGFILGFPNADLHLPLRRCFGYQTLMESPLQNWVPPDSEAAALLPDPGGGQSSSGDFSPPCTAEYWPWRTRLNMARAVIVNSRLRVVYKLLAGGTLNVLNVEPPEEEWGPLDLAGLAAAEGCRTVRITDYHAAILGIAADQLRSHEDYCVRMTALPLCQPVPKLQFNLLFCDIF